MTPSRSSNREPIDGTEKDLVECSHDAGAGQNISDVLLLTVGKRSRSPLRAVWADPLSAQPCSGPVCSVTGFGAVPPPPPQPPPLSSATESEEETELSYSDWAAGQNGFEKFRDFWFPHAALREDVNTSISLAGACLAGDFPRVLVSCWNMRTLRCFSSDRMFGLLVYQII